MGLKPNGLPDKDPKPLELYEGLFDPQYSAENVKGEETTLMGRRPATEMRMAEFLMHYEATGYQILAACRASGITYAALHHWKARYPDFARAFDSFKQNVLHSAYGVVNRALEGRMDLTDPERARLAVDFIKAFKAHEVNVQQDPEGRVQGISIRFVD